MGELVGRSPAMAREVVALEAWPRRVQSGSRGDGWVDVFGVVVGVFGGSGGYRYRIILVLWNLVISTSDCREIL